MIATLPPQLSALTLLEELNLTNNVLTELPSFVENFTRLSVVDISANRLDHIPSGLSKCTAITHVRAPPAHR